MQSTLELLSDVELDAVTGGSYTSIDITVKNFKQVAVASKGGASQNVIDVTGVSNTYVVLAD